MFLPYMGLWTLAPGECNWATKLSPTPGPSAIKKKHMIHSPLKLWSITNPSGFWSCVSLHDHHRSPLNVRFQNQVASESELKKNKVISSTSSLETTKSPKKRFSVFSFRPSGRGFQQRPLGGALGTARSEGGVGGDLTGHALLVIALVMPSAVRSLIQAMWDEAKAMHSTGGTTWQFDAVCTIRVASYNLRCRKPHSKVFDAWCLWKKIGGLNGFHLFIFQPPGQRHAAIHPRTACSTVPRQPAN